MTSRCSPHLITRMADLPPHDVCSMVEPSCSSKMKRGSSRLKCREAAIQTLWIYCRTREIVSA